MRRRRRETLALSQMISTGVNAPKKIKHNADRLLPEPRERRGDRRYEETVSAHGEKLAGGFVADWWQNGDAP